MYLTIPTQSEQLAPQLLLKEREERNGNGDRSGYMHKCNRTDGTESLCGHGELPCSGHTKDCWYRAQQIWHEHR